MYKASRTLSTWEYAIESPFKVWKGVTQETVYDCAKYVSRRFDRNPIKVYDKSLRS